MRFLVVDDERVALRFLAKILAPHGAVVEARDGTEAVARFSEALDQGLGFDAVVLDIMMPGMDGIEAARRIRRLEAERGAAACRVLMLSCLDGAEPQIAAQYEAGADGYLTKPVNAQDVLTALANLDLPQNPLDGGP